MQQPNRPYLTIFVSEHTHHTHKHTQRIWILITLAPDTHATGERKKMYKIYIRYIYFVVISVVRQSIVLKFGIEITWYIFYIAHKLHEAGFKIGTVISINYAVR